MMEDETRHNTIAILSRVVDRAQERYIGIGMQNVSHLNAAERLRLDAEYENARNELQTAQDILKQAMGLA
jgi:hypothetical protein